MTFGNGSILLWMLEFFLFIIWFWLLIAIFSDLFRDHEASGGVKALWTVLLIVLPFIGILAYLIFRGRGMAERSARRQQAMEAQVDSRIREAVGPSSSAADQIAQAKALLDSGAINQAEFDTLKAKALGVGAVGGSRDGRPARGE
jgi:phospholipase D-like protein/putative oligomerization/nucleic acid binding protein